MKTTGVVGRKLEKLDALTSLRFFAAAMIVIGHGYAYFHLPLLPTQFPLNQGVSFFFVLSGFVLAYAYPELPTFKHTLRFLWARFARIWPAHITALLLVFCLLPSSLWYVSYHHPVAYSLANVFMVHAWIPFRESYLGLNGVSWSISTEFFFYLCFPLLLYKWHRTWAIKMLLVSSVLIINITLANYLELPASSSYQGIGSHALLYIHPLSRLFEFSLGICACSLFTILKPHANRLSFSGASLLELSIVVLMVSVLWLITLLSQNAHLLQVVGDAGVVWLISSGGSFLFFFLILIFSFQRGVLSLVLRWKWLVLLGEISFSLYLVHSIVLKYLANNDMIDLPWAYAVYWLLSLVLAYLIFRAIEMPMRSLLLSYARQNGLQSLMNKKGELLSFALYKNKTVFLFLTFLILIASLLSYHPSTLSRLSTQEASKLALSSENILSVSADYSDGLRLVALKRTNSATQIDLNAVWCAMGDVTLKQHMAIHFLDAQRNMIKQEDRLLDRGQARISKGVCFSVNTKLDQKTMKDTDTLAIALYVDVKALNSIESAMTTDWNHRRLIVPLHKDLK